MFFNVLFIWSSPVRDGSSKLFSQTPKNAGNLNRAENLPVEESASEDLQSTTADHRVNFDPDGFSCAVQNILGNNY